ncbi:MAG: TetR/AcrR family transcriptional regulator [Saprospiraceae bacterium]|nr:TetR/AcrR family transcriptional regulator [Saprospiraceae bacterium]
MNNDFLKSGRANQKAQTRSNILAAAKRLLDKSEDVSLDDIAKEAGISRATMYRYYSNVDILITEAALDINHESPEEINEQLEGMNMHERIFAIQKYYNNLALEHETAFRRYLSAVLSESISSKSKLRGARRVKTLKLALQPFNKKIKIEEKEKLINTATILMGIDPIVAGKDVCRLNDDQVNETLEWALEMILNGMEK